MKIARIPLTPDNQRFNTVINGTNYTIRLLWRDDSGWVMDLMDSGGQPIAIGIPLVTGANLLGQYAHLGLGFGLVILCDDPNQDYPTKLDLGIKSHLLSVME